MTQLDELGAADAPHHAAGDQLIAAAISWRTDLQGRRGAAASLPAWPGAKFTEPLLLLTAAVNGGSFRSVADWRSRLRAS